MYCTRCIKQACCGKKKEKKRKDKKEKNFKKKQRTGIREKRAALRDTILRLINLREFQNIYIYSLHAFPPSLSPPAFFLSVLKVYIYKYI